MRVTYPIILATLLSIGTPAALAESCGSYDMTKAEQAVYTIGTWKDLNSFFRKLKACDDGVLAEGFSDRVADLLAYHWDTTNDLQSLTDGDESFERFVLYHIDSLMTPAEAKAIIDNASNHCPKDTDELCQKIVNEVPRKLLQ